MEDEKIREQLDQLLAEIDKIRQRTDKAARAAEYASKGFVEINQDVRHLKENWESFSRRLATLETKVDSYIAMINKRFEYFQMEIKKDFQNLGEKVDSNLKWNIGITITLLTIFLGLIKFL